VCQSDIIIIKFHLCKAIPYIDELICENKKTFEKVTKMKKIIALVSMIVLTLGLAVSNVPTNILGILNVSISANATVCGDYKYFDIFDDEARIMGYTGSETTLVIPSTLDGKRVTSIWDYGIQMCEELVTVTIPNGVKDIGKGAFNGCINLTSVAIPASVTSIGDWTFMYCLKMTSVFVDENNNRFSSSEGVLFNKDKTELIYCPVLKTSFTIPNSVKNIKNKSFYSCKGLTSITIPDSVTSIGDWAFDNKVILKMYCYSGSAGETYAKNGGFNYELIENTANLTATISSNSFVYDGTAKTPAVAVSDGTTSLVKDTDYTVAYSNNTAVGTATVTITGKGKFVGKKTLTFEIIKATQIASTTQPANPATTAPATTTPATSKTAKPSNTQTTTTQVTSKTETPATTTSVSTTSSKPANTTTFLPPTDGSDIPKARFQGDNDKILNAVLAADEKEKLESGSKISVDIKIEKATPSKEDEEAIDQAMDGKKIALYFNFSLIKTIDGVISKVTSTSTPIKVTIDIPEEFRKPDRTFSIVSFKNGEAETFEDLDSDANTITIESDEFPLSALVFSDDAIAKSKSPLIPILLALFAVGASLAVVFVVRKRKAKFTEI